MSDHDWYPGELCCSTFPRLFASQAALYSREIGGPVVTDEDKAIASWYWRNLNYYHSQNSHENYWDDSPAALRIFAEDDTTETMVREYWTGLFGYGFGYCGAQHSQYTAEMEYLLGHSRARVTVVGDHNSHEVWLTGGLYGSGKWAMLDHTLSAIVFNNAESPEYLLSIAEIIYTSYHWDGPNRVLRSLPEYEDLVDNDGAPFVNRGWYISGKYFPLANHDARGSDVYDALGYVSYLEPLSGYAGPPPMIALRRGERLRRYLRPGLGGSTYVFWGANESEGNPGPDAVRTWVHQPEKMYQAVADALVPEPQAEYGNGVYTYTPDFSTTAYQEGVASEDGTQVTFYFYSPYVIGAAPPNDELWAQIDQPSTDGLLLTATAAGVDVQVSSDNGATWSPAQTLSDSLDLTDQVKGHHSYHLRFNDGASSLVGKNISMRTVVQCNDRLIPHLTDGGSQITYQSSGKAVFAAGPNRDQTQTFVTGGAYNSGSTVELTVPAPGNARILEVFAAGWANSYNAPPPGEKYSIRVDPGTGWQDLVSDWEILSLGYQSYGNWSQSFVYGSLDVSADNATSVKVEFSNDALRSWRKAEVYLVYETDDADRTRVTFNWDDDAGTSRSASNEYAARTTTPDTSWIVPTAANTMTNWVEFEPVPSDATVGVVPDGDRVPGTMLQVERLPGGDLALSWGRSCEADDGDYEIYAGTIGDFTSHAPASCTTGGSTSTAFTPAPGSRYYLVVARDGGKEGSYGTDSAGAERPQGAAHCLPQAVYACGP